MKRQDLLDSAEQLFAKSGYGKTQISEIARVAKTGISTFYRYFESKEALLSTLVAELFDPLAETLRERRSGIEELSPPELVARIRETFELAFDALLARPRLTQILFSSGFGASPVVSNSVRRELDAFAGDLGMVFDHTQRLGLVEIPDTTAFARGIIGVILHLAHDHITTGSPDRETAIDVSTRMTIGGLMTYATAETQPGMAQMLALLLGRSQ